MLTETITWHPVSEQLPDADLTVHVATQGCEEPVWLGFLDGETWRDVDGMEITVTHWAEMLRGPGAAGVGVPIPPGECTAPACDCEPGECLQQAPATFIQKEQHGGRPMTLRECMEAEEPSGVKEDQRG